MKKNFLKSSVLLLAAVLAVNTGCSNGQSKLKEEREASIPEDGVLEIEIESLAKPDNTPAEEKAFFLAVTAEEDTDISVQYTYDTYGKEGAVFCCEARDSESDKESLKPVWAVNLAQLSKESYGETWLSRGGTLSGGENLFYLNGGERTLPYRMTLRITFQEPEKIGKAAIYPGGEF